MILIVLNLIQEMSKGSHGRRQSVLHSCKTVTESYPRSRSKKEADFSSPGISLFSKTHQNPSKPTIFRFCSSTVFQGELSTHLHPHCAPPAPEDQLEMHPSWVFSDRFWMPSSCTFFQQKIASQSKSRFLNTTESPHMFQTALGSYGWSKCSWNNHWFFCIQNHAQTHTPKKKSL